MEGLNENAEDCPFKEKGKCVHIENLNKRISDLEKRLRLLKGCANHTIGNIMTQINARNAVRAFHEVTRLGEIIREDDENGYA